MLSVAFCFTSCPMVSCACVTSAFWHLWHSELRQIFPGQPKHCPLTHGHSAEFFVELDCRLVPVEHRPFQSAALPVPSDCCDVAQQSIAETAPAIRFIDKQIFDVNSWQAEKSRIVV